MKRAVMPWVAGAILLAVAAGALYRGSGVRVAPPAGAGNVSPRGAGADAGPAAADARDRRILYYRNPMGLPDTSPVPKKDSMGMDYVPVHADEVASGPAVRISADRLQRLGVRTEPAAARALTRILRIVGTLQPDESRESTVSPRFEGWITQLFVSTTGSRVQRGQALLEVYSPDLASAQQDYQLATRALQALGEADAGARAGMERLVQGSLERLRNWGIDDTELADLRAGGTPRRNTLLRAPLNGVVLEKSARVGMRFMPGEPLYQLADLSRVWLVGRVFEQDLGLVHVGAPVAVSFVAYPGERFKGTVTFVAPVLQPGTRTADVRVELDNATGRLKPAMYGSVEIDGGSREPRLAVPDSAVLDTGTRQLVLVDGGNGEFEPRTVRTGMHADGYTEVLAGVAPGEAVVVNGNFLIDSESNLRAAVGASAAPATAAASSGSRGP